MSLALGGLKDEGGEIDETSGNRVPIGGTKEGVRDDIPANVSEGEFIFSADVVRYHGLDKMMALRQEAKMGLKQMERMGQMGNSDEATMPDDLPFSIADLIVVNGKGESMEFHEGGVAGHVHDESNPDPDLEGGFVPYTPKFETLKIADVPMMDNQKRISYEGYTNPKITMKEYRNEEGESIIITYINGVSIIPIPEGYTLYVPPEEDAEEDAEDDVEDDPVQKAVNTVNDYDGSNETDFVEQSAPDYRVMNNDEFFAYMSEVNSFGGKAGKSLAIAVGSLIPIPGVGLLTLGAMKNHENNLMTNMKSRIDRMPNGPQKTAALASYKEYSGEIDPTKKRGLLNVVTDFVMGLAVPLANALGINKQDVAKVAQDAATVGVSGTAAYDEKVKEARANIISPAQSVTPTADQTRPDNLMPTVRQMVEGAPKGNVVPDQIASPLGNVLSAEADQGMVPAPASTSVAARSPTDFQYDAQNKALISGRIADQNIINDRNAFIKANNQAKQIEQNAEQIRADAARERSLTMPGGSDQSVSKGRIKRGKPVGAAPRYDENRPYFFPEPNLAIERPVTQTDAALRPQTDYGRRMANARGDSFVGRDFQTAGILGDAIGAINKYGANNLGGIDPSQSEDSVVKQLQDNVYTATPSITQAPVAPTSETRRQDSQTNLSVPVADFATPMDTPTYGTSLKKSPTDFQYAESDPRNTVTGIGGYTDATSFDRQAGARNLAGTGVDAQMTAAIPPQQGLISKQMEGMGSPLSPVTSPTGLNVEPRARSMYEYPVQETAPKETPAQRRAKEAAAQRARIQARNKEIAVAIDKIPNRIKKSSYYNDQVKAGFTGSTLEGYAVGKIAGSDGDSRGVVQKADGKVQKVRDVQGYENLKGTQRGAMTVFQDSNGNQYVKSTTGKLTNLNGSKYTGPGDAQGGSTGKSGGTGKSGSTGSGRSKSDIQADINRAQAEVGAGNWSSELNDLVAERDNSSNDNSSDDSGGGGFFDDIAEAWNDFWGGDD